MYQKITEQELYEWIQKPENYNLEFKKAQNSFSLTEIYKYTSAIANEGGGLLILGIEDTTKNLIGTKAFTGTHTSLPNDIAVNVGGIRVDIDEVFLDGKRILIFRIPTRPTGRVIKYNKVAWVRYGESCKDMADEAYEKILSEIQVDETQKVVLGATLEHIDAMALEKIKRLWVQETGKTEYLQFDVLKTLVSLGLADDANHIFLAGILLAGTEQALRKFAPQAEIILEWRSNKNKTNFDFRSIIRKPFVLAIEEIWTTINARNIRFPFQEGFIQRQVWAYNEKSIREAVMNAFVHRDYRIQGGSIYILFSPENMIIESPGGLSGGVTVENILYRKHARNRLLAEACVMLDLMEKSGQGLDDIFRECISSGKGKPTITADPYLVALSIPVVLQDADFVQFIERVENERNDILPFESIIELEHIRQHGTIENPEYKKTLLEMGLIEHIGHGRGTRYLLSKRYFQYTGKNAEYTKLRGLDRDKKIALILQHLEFHTHGNIAEFQSLFPEMIRYDISNLLQYMKTNNLIEFIGDKKTGYWKKSII